MNNKRKRKPTDSKVRDHYGRKVPAIASRDTAVKRFAKSVDMDALKMFVDEQEVPKYQTLMAMMGDPAYRGLTFATLLRKAQISLQDIQGIYSDGMRHMGLLRMMNHLPSIMEDVAEDARSTMVPCSRCDSIGVVPLSDKETRPCPSCHGERYVRQSGDKHARDLVFESAKLTGQKVPLVAIQNNFDMDNARMETMLKRTRQITLEPKKPVDTPD